MGTAKNIVGAVKERFSEGREAISNLSTSPEEIQETALNLCRGALKTCTGSGSPISVIKDTAQAYLSGPASIASGAMNLCTKIASAHPIDGMKEGIKGIGGALKAIAVIGVSPIALTTSTIRSGLRMGKNATTAAINSPIKAFRVAERGANQILDLLGPTSVASSPGNDNNTPAPPAATASATQKAA